MTAGDASRGAEVTTGLPGLETLLEKDAAARLSNGVAGLMSPIPASPVAGSGPSHGSTGSVVPREPPSGPSPSPAASSPEPPTSTSTSRRSSRASSRSPDPDLNRSTTPNPMKMAREFASGYVFKDGRFLFSSDKVGGIVVGTGRVGGVVQPSFRGWPSRADRPLPSIPVAPPPRPPRRLESHGGGSAGGHVPLLRLRVGRSPSPPHPNDSPDLEAKG